jgi:peptidoglycan biosynthesis protein MviN/MurJ (putative lipid II flippase)
MNRLTHAIGQFLFPDKTRKYSTFRTMTIFVAVLFVWSVVFGVLFRISTGALHARHRYGYQLLHSPLSLVIYNITLAIGFWAIYASRERREHYLVRVVLYGMLLGGVAGEVVRFLFEHYLEY